MLQSDGGIVFECDEPGCEYFAGEEAAVERHNTIQHGLKLKVCEIYIKFLPNS